MKKYLLLLFLINFISMNTQAQSAYYDAIFLKKYIVNNVIDLDYRLPEQKELKARLNDQIKGEKEEDKEKRIKGIKDRIEAINNLQRDSVYGLLIRYKIIDSTDIGNDAVINTKIGLNPYLRPFTFPGTTKGNESDLRSVSFENAFPGSGSAITMGFDGLAKFLIKRGKEELLIYVVNKLKDDEMFPELKILFPKTRVVLDNFEAWEYANVMNTIREAFNKDFQLLLENISNLSGLPDPDSIKNAKAKKRVKAILGFLGSNEGRIFKSVLIIGNGFSVGNKIPDVIQTIASADYMGGEEINTRNAIRFLDLLSWSVKSKDPKRHYISANDFTTMMGDPNQRMLFFGLLYQQLKNEDIIINGVELAAILEESPEKYVLYIEKLMDQANALKGSIDELNDARKKGEKDLLQYYVGISESVNSFFKSFGNISDLDSRLKFPQKLQVILGYSNQTLEIAHDLSTKNYNAAVVGVLGLMSEFIRIDDEKSKEFKEFFLKYGSFAANIVEAKNSDDAEAAIAAIALPAGSYSIKQNSISNWAINAYIGYGFDVNYAHGVYAPLGLSYSWGLGQKKGGAFTLFASAIDVGSLVSYRLTNGNTDELKQEVRLESIISPSFQAFFVIPGLPIAIGGGYKRTPKLFYSKNSFEVTQKSRDVLNFSVLLDIPILNLKNHSRR